VKEDKIIFMLPAAVCYGITGEVYPELAEGSLNCPVRNFFDNSFVSSK
jgi:hypothetical protein